MNKYIYWSNLFLLVLIVGSCSEMNDLHRKYLDEGEIVYSPKVDTILVWTGHNRQQLEIEYNSRRIESGTVYWNNNTDSLNFEFPQPSTGPLLVLLPDMEEGDYTYNLVTWDIYGNKSIPDEINGKVYGSSYIASLSNKVLSESAVTSPDGVNFTTVLRFRQAENAIGMKLIYTNLANETVELDLENDALEVRLEDNIQGSEFTYTTYFIPDSTCLDIFQSDWRTAKFPVMEGDIYLDRSGWEIIEVSSEEPGEAEWQPGAGYATAILDGDLNSFWHSSWDGSVVPPHHITVDMKQECRLTAVEIYRRLGSTDTKTVVIKLSTDNQIYQEVGSIDFGDSNDNNRTVSFPEATARYMKVIVTESNRQQPYGNLAEVYAIWRYLE